MSNINFKFRNIIRIVLICSLTLLISNCSKKLDPDPLPLTVKQNFALLQDNPQFVMYFNFKKMRDTKFWDQFISDSLFSSERNFGSFLNILKQSTGVSITNGIDELYFSNSWIGDNALVVKGTFDRKRVDDYVSGDTLYTKINYPGGITVYKQLETNFNLLFQLCIRTVSASLFPLYPLHQALHQARRIYQKHSALSYPAA